MKLPDHRWARSPSKKPSASPLLPAPCCLHRSQAPPQAWRGQYKGGVGLPGAGL